MFIKTLIGAALAGAISAASLAASLTTASAQGPLPGGWGNPPRLFGDYGGHSGDKPDNWEGNGWRGDTAPAASPSQVTLVNGGRYYGRVYGGYGGGYYGRGYGGYGGGYYGQGYGGGYARGYYGGGGYYGHSRWGPSGGAGVGLGTILLIILIVYMLGLIH